MFRVHKLIFLPSHHFAQKKYFQQFSSMFFEKAFFVMCVTYSVACALSSDINDGQPTIQMNRSHIYDTHDNAEQRTRAHTHAHTHREKNNMRDEENTYLYTHFSTYISRLHLIRSYSVQHESFYFLSVQKKLHSE